MEFRGSALNSETDEILPDVVAVIEPTYVEGEITYGDGWHYTEPDTISGWTVRNLPDGPWKVYSMTHVLAVVVKDGQSDGWALTPKGSES